ncbi:MAG: hypothetical protein M0R03_01230 [Novosphingobium sp.]|nr:hypothetical protein [Novosphingobium sp.]
MKSDFTHYFAAGFMGGLVLLFSVMGGPDSGDAAGGVVPRAQAAALP